MKTCSTCKEVKSFDNFWKDKMASDGFNPNCKTCQQKTCQQKSRKKRINNETVEEFKERKEKNAKYTRQIRKEPINILKYRYQNLRYASTCHKNNTWANCPFEMTFKQYECLSKQPCHLCRVIGMNSVDKIIKELGYVIDNIRPCCWECNKMRGGLDLDYFINKCKIIGAV